METIQIHHSKTLTEAVELFLSDVRQWVDDGVRETADSLPIDQHDQGTFTTGWEPYVQHAKDKRALQYMKDLRDKSRKRFEETGLWKHGYWKKQEAHHGTEHYELFLASLWRLDPRDDETIRQVVDAAEHMGNWADDIPEWFNWESGLFHSIFFGTDGSDMTQGAEMNVPDHLRCVNICLLAFRMTGERRYLQLPELHGGKWAEAILEKNILPYGLCAEGPVYELSEGMEKLYRSFVGELPEQFDLEVNRAENILAAGGINSFLDLWKLTNDKKFLQAAEKLLDVIALELSDPDAGAAADIIGKYRRMTMNDRYDKQILKCVENVNPHDLRELSVDVSRKHKIRPSGIGKRRDLPFWYEDGDPRRHNPMLLALAAEITGDQELARVTVDLARTYFRLGRRLFPHGYHHGCSARTVNAIARGHGRDNHAGMTTAVLEPLLRSFKVL